MLSNVYHLTNTYTLHVYLTYRNSKQCRFIRWQEYAEVAAKVGVAGENIAGDRRLDIVTEWLHNAGVLLYFGNKKKSDGRVVNKRGLSDWVILDPQFLIDAMACVITKRHRFTAQGKFPQKSVYWMFQPLKVNQGLIHYLFVDTSMVYMHLPLTIAYNYIYNMRK